jgi:hypothetical protein
MLKQVLFDQYPILTKSILKSDTNAQMSQHIVDQLHSCIDDHAYARFVGEFDHYSHTFGLNEHIIADDVVDARCVMFCFGKTLNGMHHVVLCPHTVGVFETTRHIDVVFLMTPSEEYNEIISGWIDGLTDTQEILYESHDHQSESQASHRSCW